MSASANGCDNVAQIFLVSAFLKLTGREDFLNLGVFCIRQQIPMNLQWMKMKIPQALMTPEIHVQCWTFLHPLDAAMSHFWDFFPNSLHKLNSSGLVHRNISDCCK